MSTSASLSTIVPVTATGSMDFCRFTDKASLAASKFDAHDVAAFRSLGIAEV